MKISDTSSQDVPIQRNNKHKRVVLPLLLIAGVALAAWLFSPAISRWAQAQESVSAERLRTAVVERGNFVRDVSVQGRVVAAVSPVLYASQSGTISFVVDSGDTVEQAQVLATIDSPELQNQLLQEQSRLLSLNVEYDRQRIASQQAQLESQKAMDSASINLKAAKRELDRADRAFAQGAVTEVDRDKARDNMETAEVMHKHAVLDTELDNERLEFELQTRRLAVEQQTLLVNELTRQVNELTILSPVNGIVGNLLVNQKTNVIRNQPVLSVVDLSAFEIEVQIPESYVNDLAIGMNADVRSGTQSLNATLVAVSPEIIDNQVTGRLRFAETVPDGLRQNQRLTTRILLEEKQDVLMVQRGQFVDSGNGRVAYVLRDGMARRTAIEIGASSLTYLEILNGLQAGDTIVVSSTDTFNNAETVLINR
ncbi:MAG: HlyD family efflux transporter periplasmic adaptor subunit [Pseudohongiella sp.]|nr:HlyD family efflux transporter periplasmic adaptor subunit [Pseudohongiella sp.]